MTDKYEIFFKHLAETGLVRPSAIEAGFPGTRALHERRKTNPWFEQRWLWAMEAFEDTTTKEALSRAVLGTKESVYHRGKIVGETVRYSDELLHYLLRRQPGNRRLKVLVWLIRWDKFSNTVCRRFRGLSFLRFG